MKYRKGNNSGIILIIVLWILIILTSLAVGMWRRARLELSLTRYSLDKLKTRYIAEAGLRDVIMRIRADSTNERTKDFDTLYECGVSIDSDVSAEDLFKNRLLGKGSFSVAYSAPDSELTVYGLQDEERKININALNAQDYFILIYLLESFDVEPEQARTIAASVVDWRDSNSDITNSPDGAEDDYYTGGQLPHYCKDSFFESTEEILLVKDMTEEIFSAIKDYITVYPLEDQLLKVNVNTADARVLTAIAQASLSRVPGAEQADVVSLVAKIIEYRSGDDGVEITADDRPVPLSQWEDLGLNAQEQSLFIFIKNRHFKSKSQYFRVTIEGVFHDNRISTLVETVVNRADGLSLTWNEE
ncbi:general secretion pathway protein GspK [Candidatus Omnitrophota bacterium]